jgi:SAM-dependent methyltransferase
MRRKLEEQVEIMEREPEAAMVYGRTLYWFSWSGNPEDAKRDFVPGPGVETDRLFRPPALVTALLRNQIVTSTNGLTRRALIEQVAGYEESFRGLYEDQAFFSKICLRAPVFVSDRCWYRYRKHPDSCCSVMERSGNMHSERLTFLSWLEEYLFAQRILDAEVWQELKRERLRCRYPVLFRLPEHVRYRVTIMRDMLKQAARRALPVPLYHWIQSRRLGPEYRPAVGKVSFGNLHRVTPVSRLFGYDRGQPVDRYYIEGFLARHAGDIRGRVLEIGDDAYTRRFGGDRVTKRDVLQVEEGHPGATVIADLTRADHIANDSFDCIILTQTLHLIYDVRAALATVHRILKPGGVLLATFPGISQKDRYEWGKSWYWGFTALSARRLFEEAFQAENLYIETHGNVLAAMAFLQGLALEELRKEELDYNDPDYEVTIAVRAKKETG